MEKFDIKADNMLDIGCADGDLSLQMAKVLGVPQQNVIGIDIRQIPNAKIQIEICDLEAEYWPIATPVFKVATIQQVLHHIRNWRKML